MHTSQKKGLYKSLLTIFVVILAGILMLTGCSDKEARQSATNAATGAANAQTSADAAKAAADAAQAAADEAANQAKINSEAIAGLPDDEAISESINEILSGYVKGELAADSILTNAEITAILGEYAKLSALTSYVQTSELASYAKASDVTALTSALTAAKTELVTTLGNYCLKTDTLTKEQIATDIATAVEGVIKASEVETMINTRLASYDNSAVVDKKLTDLENDINAMLSKDYATLEALEDGIYDLETGLEAYAKISAVNDMLKAYCKNDAVDGKLATLEGKLQSGIDNLRNEVYRKNEVYNKTEIVSQLDQLEEALKNDYNGALKDYTTLEALRDNLKDYAKATAVADLLADFNENKTGVQTELTAINAKLSDINTSVLEAIRGDIEDIAEAAVTAYANAYAAATDYIEETGLPTIEAKIAEYKEDGHLYTPEALADIISKLETSKLMLLRMQTVEAAKAYIDDVIEVAAEEKNIAQLLADALDAVTRPILVPIDTEEEIANNEITKCEDLLALAVAQITDATEFAAQINNFVDGEATRNLQAETETYRAYYNLMVAAKAGAPAVVTAIDAIPFYNAENANYDDLKVDDCVWNADHSEVESGDRFDFNEALNNSVNYIAGADWYKTYMGKSGEAFEDDDDANLVRLISNHAKYQEALARKTALGELDVVAARMNSEAFELLKAAGYFVYDEATATQITTGKAAYTSYEALNAKKTEIDTWLSEQGVTVNTNPIPYYTDLVAATAYAEDMDELFDEATTAETGIIAILDKIIAKLPGMALSDEAEVIDARTALDAFELEFAGDDDNFKAVVNYVPAESELYAGSTRIAEFEKCEARIIELTNAKNAAVAINEKIDALELVADVNSMATIRTIRNDIVTWCNDYNIVPEAYVAGENASPILFWIHNPASVDVNLADALKEEDAVFVEANFGMINIDKLDVIFNLVNDDLKEAITAAKPVMDLIAALKVDDAKPLYQFAAKEEARKAYDAWIKTYKINNPDLSAYDFGEGNEDTFNEGKSVLIASYIKYNTFSQKVETTYGNAKSEYALFATDLDAALAAITVDNILLSDGKTILPLYASADTWFNKYLDTERNFNEVIKSLTGILEQDDYEDICELKAAYDVLLAAAEAAAALIKTEVDALNDPATIYDGDKIVAAEENFTAWVTLYSIDKTDFDSDDVPESLKYMGDVLADLENIRADYDTLVAGLVARIDTVKASLTTINAATLTIYSRETLKTDLAVVFDWIKDAGLNVTDNGFVAAFEGVDDADLKAFGAGTELTAFEAKFKALLDIEADKQEETVKVIAAIDVLGTIADDGTVTLVAGFNTSNRAATEAARAAYADWLAGTTLDTGAVDLVNQADYDARCKYIVTNYALLEAAEARLAEIDVKLDAAKDAIDALSNPASLVDKAAAEPFAALKAAIDAADDAVADFYEINGDTNDGGLSAAYYEKLYKAKAYLVYYEYINTNALAAIAKLANEDLTLGVYGTLYTAYLDVQSTFADITDADVATGTNAWLNYRLNSFANELVSLYTEYQIEN